FQRERDVAATGPEGIVDVVIPCQPAALGTTPSPHDPQASPRRLGREGTQGERRGHGRTRGTRSRANSGSQPETACSDHTCSPPSTPIQPNTHSNSVSSAT